MSAIYVTKTYLPAQDKYLQLLNGIWERSYVTNNGPLAIELEGRLKDYLKVPYLHWVSNGTIALQVALNSLAVKGEVLTTPFTYVATANSIIWENCTPVFVDINPMTFSIDCSKLEERLTEKTTAILAVHVYGYPCDVEGLSTFAQSNGLSLIYDASHAFGSKYRGKALCDYGDLSTLSFHATKVFHTVEGGAVVGRNEGVSDKLKLAVTHGHQFEEYVQVGINGKNSEFHAGIGLLNLDTFESVVTGRKIIFEYYISELRDLDIYMISPAQFENFEYNYCYAPVLFKEENDVLTVIKKLNEQEIYPRRYFYPVLNTLPYLNPTSCPVAEDVASRILCLPLYHDLDIKVCERIVSLIKEVLR